MTPNPPGGDVLNEDHLRDAWESLGVAFAFNTSQTRHADPERTLLASVTEFREHRKTLSLVLGWLGEWGDLVHVERLKSLSADLSAADAAWLGGLAAHQLAHGDLRWKAVVDSVERRMGLPMPRFPTSRLDELQAQRKGEDPHFGRFGLRISIAAPADTKKLRPFSDVVRANLWLRMRALFGANWRADMATVLVLQLAENPYQAEQLLGCSRETAYRNWKSLKVADVEKLLQGAAA